MRKARSSGSGEDNTMAVMAQMKNFPILCMDSTAKAVTLDYFISDLLR